MVAKREEELTTAGTTFMNQALQKEFDGRTLESIKGQQRAVSYKRKVQEYLESNTSVEKIVPPAFEGATPTRWKGSFAIQYWTSSNNLRSLKLKTPETNNFLLSSAFRRMDGCANNIYLLDMVLKSYRRRLRSVFVAIIDIAKAIVEELLFSSFLHLFGEAESVRRSLTRLMHSIVVRLRERHGRGRVALMRGPINAPACPIQGHCQAENLIGAVYLSKNNAGVLRQAQRRQKPCVQQKGKCWLDPDVQ
ncbi:hypothetical protein HHI36_024055 [Cryptolaemus montrouzieri]|uniref:Uncharacterized protein n=1 Tax=Cryptolaemus montrouzieri TaxID=559131 RepID=A0ABD2NJA9_9CUCU